MSVRERVVIGLAVAWMAVAGAAWADPPAESGGAPVGLEKLRKKSGPSGPLSGGSGDGSAVAPPDGAKSLGHGPEEGAADYRPGAPSGDRSARPDTIGGGTRVKGGASSALDDIR